MADFPDKSEPQTPKKEIKPLISGAKPIARPASRRFMDYLLAESPKAIAGRVGRDIIVPRLKGGFEEAVNGFLSGMLWGDGSKPMSNIVRGTVLRSGGINYQGISSQQSGLQQARQANEARSSGNYQDLVCGTQQQAEILLAGMFALLNQYNVVAVGDLYEMANITPAPSDNAYGWVTLDGSRIVKAQEGYVLQLPRPNLI